MKSNYIDEFFEKTKEGIILPYGVASRSKIEGGDQYYKRFKKSNKNRNVR